MIFEINDEVRHKNGGPIMIVVTIKDGRVETSWWDSRGKAHKQACFAVSELEKVNSDEEFDHRLSMFTTI